MPRSGTEDMACSQKVRNGCARQTTVGRAVISQRVCLVPSRGGERTARAKRRKGHAVPSPKENLWTMGGSRGREDEGLCAPIHPLTMFRFHVSLTSSSILTYFCSVKRAVQPRGNEHTIRRTTKNVLMIVLRLGDWVWGVEQ